MKRCLELYHHNPQAFQKLQYVEMCQDFSWNVPAGKYMQMFHKVCGD